MNTKRLNDSYLIINLVFAGIILLIIAYSLFFSAGGYRHPVPSGFYLLHEENYPSQGLSRSFSAIVRLNFEQARLYNEYGIRIFLFFFIQLILRITCSILLIKVFTYKRALLVYFDVTISILLFIISFLPFIRFLFQ